MRLLDRTAHSPTSYRRRKRPLESVDLAVLHQTGTPRMDPTTPALDRVRAHLLVLDDGEVRLLHPLDVYMRYGSSVWNPRCVTVEVRANLPTRYTGKGKPVWWRPDLAGADTIEAKHAQVRAVREVLAWLRQELPALRYVGAHRQVEAGKGGCPGPDLWRECGEYARRVLGYELVATDARGKALPSEWVAEPTLP